MGGNTISIAACILLSLICIGTLVSVHAEDPYLFFDWKVTYGKIGPLGIPQQGILINGMFPGPTINCTTNNNLVINVHNDLNEPFLLSWNGIQLRKNSWLDGMPGTMCPIPLGKNYTYRLQVKDQIGSYYYFPSLAMHRASGGIGPIQIHSRPLIPVPFDRPANEFFVVMGDWYNKGYIALKKLLDNGQSLGRPDGVHINGKSGKAGGKNKPLFVMEKGKTYRYRICNVGTKMSLNFRIQGHRMKLVELEGSHTLQNLYESLDVHVGQCLSVLVTADQKPMDYYLVASTRFTHRPLVSVGVVRYAGSKVPASPQLPQAPPESHDTSIPWSINQFRTFRWNLTASAARPNPQGSYHYGNIKIARTFKFVNSKALVNGKLRYAINGVSHVDSPTPIKLAEYYDVEKKVFKYDVMKDQPPRGENGKVIVTHNVINATFRSFVEIIFENTEKTIQTWQMDGYSFFAVAIEHGTWTPAKRKSYNLKDAVSRHSIQVYPHTWAAVMTTLDNAGVWNVRSEMWERFYLGQQLYLSVQSPVRSLRDEYDQPNGTVLCGIVKGLPKPAYI